MSLVYSYKLAFSAQVTQPKKASTPATAPSPVPLPPKSDLKLNNKTSPSPLPSPIPTLQPPTWETQYEGTLTAITNADQATSKLQIKWITTSPIARAILIKGQVIAPGMRPGYETTIEGQISEKDWTINWAQAGGKRAIKPDKLGRFKISVPIVNERTNVPIQLISPTGKTEVRVIELKFPYFGAKIPTRWSFNAGAGLSYIIFTQQGFDPLKQFGLTVKGGFAYGISPGVWDIGLSTFFTALPIPLGTKDNIRFIGLNGRLGYRWGIKSMPDWKFGLHTGFYYTTSISNNEQMGFTGMSGPQLFPTITKRLSDKTFWTAYFKFSPVGSGLFILDLDNREVAGGTAIGYLLKNGRSVAGTIDISNLSIRLEDLVFKSQSFSLGFSFGF